MSLMAGLDYKNIYHGIYAIRDNSYIGLQLLELTRRFYHYFHLLLRLFKQKNPAILAKIANVANSAA